MHRTNSVIIIILLITMVETGMRNFNVKIFNKGNVFALKIDNAIIIRVEYDNNRTINYCDDYVHDRIERGVKRRYQEKRTHERNSERGMIIINVCTSCPYVLPTNFFRGSFVLLVEEAPTTVFVCERA